MEHIILGYDGSGAARSALDWVADRAARRLLDVTVVAVANMFGAERPVIQAQQGEAVDRLRNLAPRVDIDTRIFDGVMPGTLVQAARDADMLVMGVHTGARLLAFLNGSIPLRASARSQTPVCLVPAGWGRTDGAVSVGLSSDDSSDTALAYAAAEAAKSDRPLKIVHSWLMMAPARDPSVASTPVSRVARFHQNLLDSAVNATLRSYPDMAVSGVLVRDNPAAALAAVAGRDSLLVIGTHHRGLLAGGLLGSVAWDLIGQVDRPICVVSDAR